MNSGRHSSFKLIVLVLIFIICAGISAAFNGITLIPFVRPLAVVLALVLPTGFICGGVWRKLTGCDWRWVNYLCHVLCGGSILLAAFYTLNYCCADKNGTHRETATIVSKYTMTRHKTKRIRRNTYGQGEAYKVYCIDLRFECGVEKRRELKPEKYRKLRVGDILPVSVRRGLFGIDVVE